MARPFKDKTEQLARGARLRRALDALGWPVLRFATHIGQRITVAQNWAKGTQGEIPDPVLHWVEAIAAPLVKRPRPAPSWPISAASDMPATEFGYILDAMKWDAGSLALRLECDPADLRAMESGDKPVGKLLAKWLREVSAEVRGRPMPPDWQPRVVINWSYELRRPVETPIEGRAYRDEVAAAAKAREEEREREKAPALKLAAERSTPIEQAVAARAESMRTVGKYEKAIAKAKAAGDKVSHRRALNEYRVWQAQRSQAIRDMRGEGWTFLQIAHRLGITRQRAEQIARTEYSPVEEEAVEAA